MSESDDRRQSTALPPTALFELISSEHLFLSVGIIRGIVERRELEGLHVGNYDFFYASAVCVNRDVNENIIRLLLEKFPAAASKRGDDGEALLHHAIENPSVTPNIIKLLIDAAPDSVRSVDNDAGSMPLHSLCVIEKDEPVATEILKLLIEEHPELVRCVSGEDDLPIHLAVKAAKSLEFCQVLIEAYPGSERIADARGLLPLHLACMCGDVATVKYLYKVYPDAINHAATRDGVAAGIYPIHLAIGRKDDPVVAFEIVKFLLDSDPNVKLQKLKGETPLLRFVCERLTNSMNEAKFEMIKTIYDAHPESIEDDEFVQSIRQPVVQYFLHGELVYARRARDHRRMVTPDDNGQLPLHRALQNNVTLGSIKLLVKGNPTALQSPDNGGALPLHIACQHHGSASVIHYLIGLDTTTLNATDREGNTALHYACRGAKYETITMLLEKYDATSVSRRNAHKKLPIDLLWESNAVEDIIDRLSIEYTSSVFLLLRANPEMMFMTSNMTTKQSAGAGTSQSGKRRKFAS